MTTAAELAEIHDHMAGGIDEWALHAPPLPGALVLGEGMTREEWLATRAQLTSEGLPQVGASMVASILGVEGAFGSCRTAWKELRGEGARVVESEAMEAGSWYEQRCAERFSQKSGIETVEPNPLTIYASREFPFATASPDRLAVAGDKVTGWVESKWVGAHRAEEWTSPPAKYEAQVRWQLLVSHLPVGYLVAEIGGQRMVWFEIERDEYWEEYALNEVRSFLELVVSGREPEADDSEATKRALAAEFADATPEPLEGGCRLAQAVAELMDAQDIERSTKARLTQAENAVQLLLREHEVGTVDGTQVVTWKTQRRAGYTVEPGQYRRLVVPKSARTFFAAMEGAEL